MCVNNLITSSAMQQTMPQKKITLFSKPHTHREIFLGTRELQPLGKVWGGHNLYYKVITLVHTQ